MLTRGRLSASTNALVSQVASSSTNALFSAISLAKLPIQEAGLVGVVWSAYFLVIAFAKGSTVFNGGWDPEGWSYRQTDILVLAIVPGACGAVALAAYGFAMLGATCFAFGPVLVISEIVRQQSLVGDGALAVRFDTIWLAFCLFGFGLIWVTDFWRIELLFSVWAGSSLAALLVVWPRASIGRGLRSATLSLTGGAEHLTAGASFSLVALGAGAKFGLASVATIRLLQLLTTPVRLVQAAAQPVLFGQHCRSDGATQNTLQRNQAVVLTGAWAALIVLGAGLVYIWPRATSRNDLTVSWPTFGWYSLVLLGNVALMPSVARLRTLQRAGILLRWRLGLVAATLTAYWLANGLSTALAGVAVCTLTLAIWASTTNFPSQDRLLN